MEKHHAHVKINAICIIFLLLCFTGWALRVEAIRGGHAKSAAGGGGMLTYRPTAVSLNGEKKCRTTCTEKRRYSDCVGCACSCGDPFCDVSVLECLCAYCPPHGR
ncbi:hypothetical protein LINPERPRIM_LOCUS23350 [Linum perenne]